MELVVDGLIILLYFAGIIAIGLYMGRREESLHDFALGGRRVPWWAVMASIIAAETSAATFLGTPGEGFDSRSFAYVQLIVGLILGRVIVGYFFLRPYYQYKVYTVYDYLGIRFGEWTKNYVSALFLFMRTLASGTRMFVPSLVMVLAWQLFTQHSTASPVVGKVGFSTPTNVQAYVIAIVLITLLTCLYTAMGGIKAVIWTDVVQATLMFGSALVAILSLIYHIGGNSWNLLNGMHEVVRAVPELKQARGYFFTGFEPETVAKFKATNHLEHMSLWNYVCLILASPYTLLSATIASTASNMAAFGTDQDMVQRLLTAETYKKSRRSLITAAIMDLPIAAAFSFIGILLFAYYQKDPTYKPASTADVFGSYILFVMPVGIRGIVLAGVFATAMGSLSAALNALATSATNDWYIPYFARHKSESHHVFAARIFTAVFAFLMILIAAGFAYAKVKDPTVRIIPVVLGIAGFILGPMLGVFLLGMFTKRRGSDFGNMIAITVGLVTTIILGELHIVTLNLLAPLFGLHNHFVRPAWLPSVSFTWFAAIGAVIVVFVGILFPTPKRALDIAELRAKQAATGEDKPMAMRNCSGFEGKEIETVEGRGH
jgi:SSS family solute:Na+ symporter